MIAHRLYVGTIGEGLWRSSDGGETFSRASEGMFVECHVRALAIHPGEPRTLYLGSEQGLFRSSDGADHWARVESPLNGQQIWAVCFLPETPDVILAGTCPARLFRSGDGGRTWTEPSVRIRQECPRIMHTRVTTLITDPSQPQTVWAGVEIDGLLRSRDGGRSWQKVGEGLSSQDIHALAIIPANGRHKRLLASTNNDLNLSTDDGETWQPMQLGKKLPWPYFRGLAQLANRPEVVLLGNGAGPPGDAGTVAVSSDAGATWQVATMPGPANSTIWNFAVHAADADLAYASSVSGEIYRSTDAGVSWVKLKREFGEIRTLAWAP